MTQRAPDPSPDGDFVHLHVHSEFSLLDGLSRIGEMTQRVAEQGMPALALTDHGSMYVVIPFYAAAKKAGIKPIIGVEAYISPRGMTQKEGKLDADYHHMILLAKNDIGYRNLLALTTAAHLDGYYYKRPIDKELLSRVGDRGRYARSRPSDASRRTYAIQVATKAQVSTNVSPSAISGKSSPSVVWTGSGKSANESAAKPNTTASTELTCARVRVRSASRCSRAVTIRSSTTYANGASIASGTSRVLRSSQPQMRLRRLEDS